MNLKQMRKDLDFERCSGCGRLKRKCDLKQCEQCDHYSCPTCGEVKRGFTITLCLKCWHEDQSFRETRDSIDGELNNESYQSMKNHWG